MWVHSESRRRNKRNSVVEVFIGVSDLFILVFILKNVMSAGIFERPV